MAAGELVYRHHTDTAKKISDTTSSQNVTQKANQGTATTPSQSTSYLDISQWGVKLPLSSSISDAYYTVSVSTHDSNGQPNTVFLGLKSLDSSGCQASGDNSGQDSAFGAILRISPTDTDPVTGKLLTQEYPNGVTIGSYFYAYQTLNSEMCKAPSATIQSVNSAFTAATKSVSASSVSASAGSE